MYEFIDPLGVNNSVYQVRPMGNMDPVLELPILSSGLPALFDDLTEA